MKTCTKCHVSKPETAFRKEPSSKDGRRHTCYRCTRGKPPLSHAKPAAPTPAPVPAPDPADRIEITEDPLAQAYHESATQRRQKELNAQRSALLEENTRLRDQISELVKMQAPPTVLVYRQAASERADAVACAIASDWHIEEPVAREAVHGLNEYNLEIARSRSEYFFKNFLTLSKMMARESEIKTLFISALGDFFSGWIHEELIAGNLLAPGDAAKLWKDLFISGIEFLLKESDFKITVDMLPGNHGRMTRQMHFGDPTGTSLETFAYHSIAGRFEGNPRVEINVAHHAMVYRKFFENFMLRQIHGYEVKYGGGVGGLTIPLNKAIGQWDIAVKADMTALGHFHQLFFGPRFIANGSMIGYNSFAQAIKAAYEAPRQAFYQVHARNGGELTVTAPIWLDPAVS